MSAPLMSFLRPLPLPRRGSLFFLARSFSAASPTYASAQQYVNKRTPPPSRPTSKRKPAVPPRPVKFDPPPIPDINEPLPYHIHRTPSQQLPVYHLAKRGGNLLQTRLRKIDGDIMKLKLELQQALGLQQEEISINQLTRHIIIKVSLPRAAQTYALTPADLVRSEFQGWRRDEVNQFLQARNF
ncbi:MAG: hypothetical protein Q9184_005052 [Pyrenodesmia sp. 2 TL-2023]